MTFHFSKEKQNQTIHIFGANFDLLYNQFRTLEFSDFMVLDKIIKLEFLIFHSRNSHRQSTRKRWQNRSRRNWAQMASSANNNAMQKGKNFFKSKIILAARILVESSLQRSVTFPFFPSISPNHAEKTTYNYAVEVHKLDLTFCGLNLG